MSDEQVNHPKHYNDHPSGIECVDLAEQFNFNMGNAIKYFWRSGKKGPADIDVQKGLWYLKREQHRLLTTSHTSTVWPATKLKNVDDMMLTITRNEPQGSNLGALLSVIRCNECLCPTCAREVLQYVISAINKNSSQNV